MSACPHQPPAHQGIYPQCYIPVYGPPPHQCPAPGQQQIPAPGQQQIPAPGQQQCPAPGQQQCPATGPHQPPVHQGIYPQCYIPVYGPPPHQCPAPGEQQCPAPGQQQSPAPGQQQSPAPEEQQCTAPGPHPPPVHQGIYPQCYIPVYGPPLHQCSAPGEQKCPAPGEQQCPAPGEKQCSDTVEWIKTTPQDALSLSGRAVVAGYEGPDGSPLWVMRTQISGELAPGKLAAKRHEAFVSWGDKEHKVQDIEVMCVCPKKIRWVESRDGNVPPGAIAAGHTANGETFYVGRAKQQGSLTPGKILPFRGVMYMPFGGQELHHRVYETLCLI